MIGIKETENLVFFFFSNAQIVDDIFTEIFHSQKWRETHEY